MNLEKGMEMMCSNNDYDKIKGILLQHKGRANAITSKQISKAMGFPMEDTQVVSRTAIRKTEELFDLPVISCPNGYFIAENDEEIAAYNANIQRRIDGMEARRERANKNYQKWKK